MKFSIDKSALLTALQHVHSVVERRNTIPILSNVLIEAKNSKIKITATDLDIIYFEEISPKEIKKEGSTTTSSNILYDILRKLEPDAKVELSLQNTNKLKLISGNSKFNLLCMPSDNFPLSLINLPSVSDTDTTSTEAAALSNFLSVHVPDVADVNVSSILKLPDTSFLLISTSQVLNKLIFY